MSVPAFSLILFSLLCAGLFTCFAGHSTCAGRIRVPLTALAFLLLAGALPAAADPEPIKTQLDLYYALVQGGEYILENNIDLENTVYPNGMDLLIVASSSTVTIDLNDHKIDRRLTSPADNGSVIWVIGNLTLRGRGTITGGNTSGSGGGVYVEHDGTFTMSEETTITGNSAGNDGGGVYVDHGGTLNISGSPVISGNYKTESDNPDKRIDDDVYLCYEALINVTDELTKDASIGISMYTLDVFTSGLKGKGSVSNFFSDDPDYSVGIDQKSGEARLKEKSGKAETPAISPSAGTYIGPQDVTITTKTDGASIYYTTDKTDPTAESTLYTGTFTVSVSGTVKAIAVRNDLYDSDIASVTYTIEEPVNGLSVTAPSFGPATYGYAQPEAQPVIMKNNGNMEAAITNAELSGRGADSFILKGTAGKTVAAGSADSSTFTVQPAGGLDAGSYTAEVTVTYTGGSGSPAEVSDMIEFTVTRKPLSEVSVTLDPEGPFTYDGEEHSVTVVAADGDRVLKESVDYEITADSVLKARETGTYEVVVEGVSGTESEEETTKALREGNYSGTVTLTWQITGKNPEPEPEPEPEPGPGRRFFRICGDCELPATGFSSVRPTALRSQPAALRYEPVRMRLMLPTLEQDVELVTVPREGNSWAVDWLDTDAGILEGSALPGEGVTIIAAHNTLNDTAYGPFAMLATMEKGDRIFVADGDGKLLSFEVYANELLTPDGMDTIEAMAEENALVLVTCENEAIEGGYLNRRAVFAK